MVQIMISFTMQILVSDGFLLACTSFWSQDHNEAERYEFYVRCLSCC